MNGPFIRICRGRARSPADVHELLAVWRHSRVGGVVSTHMEPRKVGVASKVRGRRLVPGDAAHTNPGPAGAGSRLVGLWRSASVSGSWAGPSIRCITGTWSPPA